MGNCTPIQKWICSIGMTIILLLTVIAAGFWYSALKDIGFRQRTLELQIQELSLRTQELEIAKKAQNIRVNSGVIDCANTDQFDDKTYQSCKQFMLDNRVDD